MAFNSSTLQHPRELFPQPAVSVLDIKPEVYYQCGRFLITRQDFESSLNVLTFHFGRFKYSVLLLKIILIW